jgi:hypothetical protein
MYSNCFKNLNLPSIRTLRTIIAKYELKPGLNDFMFNFLSFKTKNFLPEALECILFSDEMSIKTHLFYNVSKDKIIGLNLTNNSVTYESSNHALVL